MEQLFNNVLKTERGTNSILFKIQYLFKYCKTKHNIYFNLRWQPRTSRNHTNGKTVLQNTPSCIRVICTSLAFGSTLLPNFPCNIFSSGLGTLIIQALNNNLLPNFGQIYLTNTLVFCGNFIMWTMHAKIGLTAAIETILILTCVIVLVQKFKLRASKPSQPINHAAIFYRKLQLLVKYFNIISSSQLVATLVAFGSVQVASVLQLLGADSKYSKIPNPTIKQYATKYSITIFSFSILFNMTIVSNFLFGFCAQVHESCI